MMREGKKESSGYTRAGTTAVIIVRYEWATYLWFVAQYSISQALLYLGTLKRLFLLLSHFEALKWCLALRETQFHTTLVRMAFKVVIYCGKRGGTDNW